MVTISNKHPEIDVDDHEIQKFLLIFNFSIKAESDKSSKAPEDSEDGIPNIIRTIAARLLRLLHNNIESLKLPDIIKGVLRKIKSFIIKDKDGTNKNDSENSIRPKTSDSESSSSEARTV